MRFIFERTQLSVKCKMQAKFKIVQLMSWMLLKAISDWSTRFLATFPAVISLNFITYESEMAN